VKRLRYKFTILLVLLCVVINVSALAAENIILKKGTIIKGVLVTPVSSKVSKVGDPVAFKTAQNLLVDKVIVIPKGTMGYGVVTKAEKATYFGVGGTIGFLPKYTFAINGVQIPLGVEKVKLTSEEQNINTVVAVIGVGIFTSFFHGQNQKMPVGTTFMMGIAQDTDLGMPISAIESQYFKKKGGKS
jgi:hypothetical protein